MERHEIRAKMAADEENLPGPKWLRDLLAKEMRQRYGWNDEDASRIERGEHGMTTAIVSMRAMRAAIKEAAKRRRK